MKDEVSDMKDLDERIRNLELQQRQQTEAIKVEFRALAASVSPKNLLKSAVKTVVGTPGLKTTVMDTAIGAVSGTLGKRLIVGKSKNIIRRLAGNAARFVISNFVRNKMPVVKEKIATTPLRNAKTLLHH